MSAFHGADPELIVNALRLILESFKTLRSARGEHKPGKPEEVLGETVDRADELSSAGAGADEVASEIETKLEYGLGRAGKDEILDRATFILALAQPLDLEAFRYYETLLQVLTKARDFCAVSNIFRLRGNHIKPWGYELLPLPGAGAVLQKITRDFDVLTGALLNQDRVIRARVTEVAAWLRTGMPPLQVGVGFEVTMATSMGESYAEGGHAMLSLAAGSEINRIAFEIVQPTSVPRLPGLDLMLTATQFHDLVSAMLQDISAYAKELAEEEHDFRVRIAPALEQVLSSWTKSQA
jgi:hypothetical protein